jgi:ATP-binding cassette, subfamily B (MDR/TAP), member 1
MSSFWNIAGERLSIRCRKEFFKSLIRQEMGWFDTISTTEIVTNFNLDALTLQQAVGEKISTMIMITSMLLTGVGLSFYSGWILSLVLLPAVLLLLFSFAKNMEIIHQQFK